MRAALGIDKKTDILDHCHSLPPAEEEEALGKIRAIERAAMISQVCTSSQASNSSPFLPKFPNVQILSQYSKPAND
jgi:hypothetical protein